MPIRVITMPRSGRSRCGDLGGHDRALRAAYLETGDTRDGTPRSITHLGYDPGQTLPEGQTNWRNGRCTKTPRNELGPIPVEVLRHREGTFEPQIVGKHEQHFSGFDARKPWAVGRKR